MKQKYIRPEEQEEEWIDAMRGDADGLGAARGVWFGIKLVVGGVLAAMWIGNTVRMARSGAWESWFVSTVFLGLGVVFFKWMERTNPQGRLVGLCATTLCLTLFFVFSGW